MSNRIYAWVACSLTLYACGGGTGVGHDASDASSVSETSSHSDALDSHVIPPSDAHDPMDSRTMGSDVASADARADALTRPDVPAPDVAITNAVFPLSLSGSGRYLVDQQGSPFLIKEISAWGLIQALSESDAADYLDGVRSRGFNTVLVSIISNDTRFAGNPPNWNGISPFTTQWNFATPSEPYFAHADRVLAMAADRGILVLLVPAYLGYSGDTSQGWFDEIQSTNNSVAHSLTYGQFLGQRYAATPNIVWVAGGDNNGSGGLVPYVTNIIDGIRQHDHHLWTGHFDASIGTNWSRDNPLYASYIDLNGMYAWTESQLGSNGPQYRTELAHYATDRFIFQLDQSYEHDTPHAPDNEDPQWIRRKNYDGLLSGCAGTSFEFGQSDNAGYTFVNWRPLLNTEGTQEAQHCFALFGSRAWQLLEPDVDSSSITAGRGNFGDVGYVCAARASDGSSVIAYVPDGQTVTVDLGRVTSSNGSARAWWFDPRAGTSTLIGAFPNTGTHQFATPDNQDWVLVVDADSLSLPAPGT